MENRSFCENSKKKKFFFFLGGGGGRVRGVSGWGGLRVDGKGELKLL